MKKYLGTLNVQTLLHHGGFTNMTPGNNLAQRFCDAVSAGNTPTRDDLETVAHALEVLRYGVADDGKLSAFSERLGTWRKQGQEVSAASGWWKYASSVADYFARREQYLNANMSDTKAHTAAKKAIANEQGIGQRAMQNRIDKYTDVAWKMYEVSSYEPPDN